MIRLMQWWVGTYVLAAGMICAVGASARAGITITSFTTTAGQNAYAPFSKTQYYDVHTVANTSPAVADVTDDWTGTNVGGTTPTWHWVGAARVEASTSFDATDLMVTGAGSFNYELTTTNGFVDPTRTGTVYTPAAGAGYQCYFTLDTPAAYTATGEIGGLAAAFLSSSESGEFFFINGGSIDQSGVIPPGHYEVSASTGLAAALLGNGVNDYIRGGSFKNFSFSVQVPEPSSASVVLIIVTITRSMRRRR